MTDVTVIARCPLFAGLEMEALAWIAGQAKIVHYAPGEALCLADDPAESCWMLTAGLVDVLGPSSGAARGPVLTRLRRGATIGDIAAILGEPHRETVVASILTTALPLRAETVRALAERHPELVRNALRAQHGRLMKSRDRVLERDLGETVAIAAGDSLRSVFPRLLAQSRMVSPRSVTTLDRNVSLAGAVTAAFDLTAAHGTVLLPAELEPDTLIPLVRECDRVIALAGTAAEAASLGRVARARVGDGDALQVVLVGDEAGEASSSWPSSAPLTVIRRCLRGGDLPIPDPDLAWLARHVTRTKLGLALGAGGAKGYAHIGVLQVLEEAGYVVDCVSGSSIGAIVGTGIALGHGATRIDAMLRSSFDADAVAEIFKISLSGRSSGIDLMTSLLQDMTGRADFADTVIPLSIMAVDLVERVPVALREGPLWEALLAATALAGFFRPFERDGRRFVDGLALVPVPTDAVAEDGADLTVAVNLIGRETLPAWPGGPAPEPPPERRRRGVLEDLLEVMDLGQLSESVRHTELADVPITPLFGPGEWRDFHLADQYLAAGRRAAEEQLPTLRSLALPAGAGAKIDPQGGGSEHRAIRI
jgi:NTE family protein